VNNLKGIERFLGSWRPLALFHRREKPDQQMTEDEVRPEYHVRVMFRDSGYRVRVMNFGRENLPEVGYEEGQVDGESETSE
jgi:hypothetical protein